MELVWAGELSVGNAVIDAEHRNLIGLVNEVISGIRSSDVSALSQAFELLEYLLRIHFANEEKIAHAVGFPFVQHKLAQQYSLKELQHMKDELAIKNGVWSDGAADHFARSLKSWMIDAHIIKLDMLMKPVLHNHGYDFWHSLSVDDAGTDGKDKAR